MEGIKVPEFRKFVDRWLLREVFGRLINSKNNRYTFIVDISDASLADAGFFNWLRKLLTGLDAKNPGKYLVLEINAKHLVNLEKQANALITYLRKTHDFKFALGNIDNVTEIARYTSRIKFDMVRCNYKIIHELGSQVAPASAPGDATKNAGNSQLDLIKSAGSRFIADHIEDATTLTEVISIGAEYATGSFIGEATTQLDDITNIETFEII
jgi:EAL domain-containing protein (putative c-di-GMP-specific phosphodiesterase class I)